MYDIFFIIYDIKSLKDKIRRKFPLAKFCIIDNNGAIKDAVFDAQKRAMTKLFWLIDIGYEIKDNFDINYQVPDWDQKYVHVFKEEKTDTYNGVYLIPKSYHITRNEAEHLFFISKKEISTYASRIHIYDSFIVDTYNDYLTAKNNTITEMFYLIFSDLKISDQFKFDFQIDVNQKHLNYVFKNGNCYDGVILTSKNQKITEKEFLNRFVINRTEVDILASEFQNFEIIKCLSYDEYIAKIKAVNTSMVYLITSDIQVDKNFKFDYQVPKWDQDKVHVFKNGEYFDGICLLPINKIISLEEFNTKKFDIKINVDIVASMSKQHETHFLSTYDEYQTMKNEVETNMFYFVNNFVKVDKNFKFDYQVPKWDQDKVHVFKNGEYFDGICLFPKNQTVTQKEFDYKFFINKVEVNIEASSPSPFDIVFISYSESNADENYQNLLTRFPETKRIHGVKGIHQAHIEAAKIVETPMFWVVDGDAQILKTFNFDYQVPVWSYDTVHVWRSQNPINGLQYGYGGVKLLPTNLTRNLDISSVDMTTSISSKFKPVSATSNISKFNTSEFDTWKSAFRECVKLSSRIISGQNDKESLYRLEVWCTEGEKEEYGKFAIEGAKLGKDFGFRYREDPAMLSKINDWNWLREEFQKHRESIC